MTLPKRPIGREFQWTRDTAHVVTLGKLVDTETLTTKRDDGSVNETRLLRFEDGTRIIDDVRVSEVKRALWGRK